MVGSCLMVRASNGTYSPLALLTSHWSLVNTQASTPNSFKIARLRCVDGQINQFISVLRHRKGFCEFGAPHSRTSCQFGLRFAHGARFGGCLKLREATHHHATRESHSESIVPKQRVSKLPTLSREKIIARLSLRLRGTFSGRTETKTCVSVLTAPSRKIV